MEVIRDATWEQCMASAMKMYRVKEPDDRCYHLADATWKCKMSYKKHEQKKSDRQLIVSTGHQKWLWHHDPRQNLQHYYDWKALFV